MAYEYLEKKAIPVKLCQEIGRIGERTVELNKKDEERAMRLHRESIVIDFHLHDTVLPEALKDLPAPYVEYIENPSEWPNLTRALVARGYPDEAIRKIIGGNVLKLLEQTIG